MAITVFRQECRRTPEFVTRNLMNKLDSILNIWYRFRSIRFRWYSFDTPVDSLIAFRPYPAAALLATLHPMPSLCRRKFPRSRHDPFDDTFHATDEWKWPSFYRNELLFPKGQQILTLSHKDILNPKLTCVYWWWLSWKIASGCHGCHHCALNVIPEWSMIPW